MELFRQVLAVGGVFLLLIATLRWLGARGKLAFARGAGGLSLPAGLIPSALRRGKAPEPRLLESVERLSLTPQHSLHLVRHGDRALIVGVSAAGCTLLESRPWTELSRGSESAAVSAGSRQ